MFFIIASLCVYYLYNNFRPFIESKDFNRLKIKLYTIIRSGFGCGGVSLIGKTAVSKTAVMSSSLVLLDKFL